MKEKILLVENNIKSKRTKREPWVDIARSILIILVVLGHYSKASHWQLETPADYVFLFHMPAFFLISGYLCKPVKNDFKSFLFKKIKRFLLPYVSYLLTITLLRYTIFVTNYKLNIRFFAKDIVKTVYGGKYLNINEGVLWFLSCLFFVEVFWAFIDLKFKNVFLKIIIVFFMFLLAHIHSNFFPGLSAPLGIDVSFLALTYYVFGYYFKKIFFKKSLFIFSVVFSAIFLVFRISGLSSYGLELATHHYDSIILDLFVPICFSVVLFNICFYASFLNNFFLIKIGGSVQYFV